jgi:ABC-type dipeptide/oligopeptide/nickel transport system ATPase component
MKTFFVFFLGKSLVRSSRFFGGKSEAGKSRGSNETIALASCGNGRAKRSRIYLEGEKEETRKKKENLKRISNNKCKIIFIIGIDFEMTFKF